MNAPFVIVIVPGLPQTQMAYNNHGSYGSHPGYAAPVPYTPPPGREEWPGCEGAIVEGGALEIRRYQNGDYDVVRGYGPTGYLSFTNGRVNDQADHG